MKTAVVHVRIEPKTKQKAEGVLRKLGLTLTEAICIFYRQISLRGGLPFPIEIPKELTASTLEKSRRGKEIQEFESLEGMFKDWGEMKKVSQTRQFSRDAGSRSAEI
jgi:DNA-damage-inducible protein J